MEIYERRVPNAGDYVKMCDTQANSTAILLLNFFLSISISRVKCVFKKSTRKQYANDKWHFYFVREENECTYFPTQYMTSFL